MAEERKPQLSLADIDAVIFDMDGVITDTASVHAAAWKQLFDAYLKKRSQQTGEAFQPFDADADYRKYVDGKPRYDGVKSFLESRGISLPYGNPRDGPNKETICGLGNRKNHHYLERLKKQGADSYPSAVAMVKKLNEKGVGTALISASRNCKAVIEAAGIQDLFTVTVDGVDSARLKLKGKPEPDIFLEAARRLKVNPERAVVVEDALAGVAAGKAGHFFRVIGVDRTGDGHELRHRGADTVVRDLGEIELLEGTAKVSAGFQLPSALENKEEIFLRLRAGTPAIFLDYDGTLTPIVTDPAKALLAPKTRDIIRRLAGHWTVAIISGRDLADVRNMVGIEEITYAGSHGFDILGPRESYHDQERGERFLPALDQAEKELRKSLQDIPGARVERKRFAIAVHYRQVAKADVGRLEQKFDQVQAQHPELRKTGGKKIFELRPNIDWDKGKAVLGLLEAIHIDSSRVVPMYIGDDVTDEDAFQAISGRGISIRVGKDELRTAADYAVQDTAEAAAFLEDLVALAEKEVAKGIWTLVYDNFTPEQEGLHEALCTLGNGYFATRGAAPESEADDIHYPGTYIGGCYNRLKTEIDGNCIENESLVNVPNWLPLTFKIEGGEWFDVQKVELLEYRQELDLMRGVLTRLIRFSDQGRQTRISQRRFVSMDAPHLAGLETTIMAENWTGILYIRTALDGRVANTGVERYRRLNNQHLTPLATGVTDGEILWLEAETNQSHIRFAEAARTRLFHEGQVLKTEGDVFQEPGYIRQECYFRMREGQAVTVEKVAALYNSRDHAISECLGEAQKEVSRAPDFEALLQRHVLAWDHLWRRCHIHVKADSPRVAQVLNLHIFHLLQTVSVHSIDLDVGVPPRGLHGEAYRGHIMWDELFIFPFLTFRIPDITRALLQYRYRRLREARWAARKAGYQGAMYPWMSGSDGREEAQTLHLNPRSGRWIPDNSDRQRHINIAVAYNVWHYYQVTGDVHFLSFYGAEMIFEIARFWASVAQYNRTTDRYGIHRVMGPDEFHDAYPDADKPGIDNNAYTNIMAVWVLCRALEILDLLPEERRDTLLEKLALRREELERWDEISRKMLVVFHDDGIISQFERYDQLKEFDWKRYRKKYGDIHRLDRILEAEGDSPNRYKVSKQADVLMLFYLLSADELRELFGRLGYSFEYETIPRNIEYYIQRTAHGSTLSRIVHSWVLSRSERELSWHLFKDALESDISDIQGGTTKEGIHLGAMAGTVDLVQRCYTGGELSGDVMWLNPHLPEELEEVEFDILYRGHRLNIRVTPELLHVGSSPSAAAPIKVGFKDKVRSLKPGHSLEFELK